MKSNDYLVIRRQFHCRHTVDVFLDLVEEVIPTSDDATLVLVVDKIKFIALPDISHLPEKKNFAIKRRQHCSTLNNQQQSRHFGGNNKNSKKYLANFKLMQQGSS